MISKLVKSNNMRKNPQQFREKERERLKHHSDKYITSILKHGHKPEGDLVDWIAVFDLNKPVADQR